MHRSIGTGRAPISRAKRRSSNAMPRRSVCGSRGIRMSVAARKRRFTRAIAPIMTARSWRPAKASYSATRALRRSMRRTRSLLMHRREGAIRSQFAQEIIEQRCKESLGVHVRRKRLILQPQRLASAAGAPIQGAHSALPKTPLCSKQRQAGVAWRLRRNSPSRNVRLTGGARRPQATTPARVAAVSIGARPPASPAGGVRRTRRA